MQFLKLFWYANDTVLYVGILWYSLIHCTLSKETAVVSHWNDTASGPIDALTSYRYTLY